MLHADVEDVGGVSDDAAEEARSGGHGNEGEERGLLVGSGDDFFKFLIDAEAGS